MKIITYSLLLLGLLGLIGGYLLVNGRAQTMTMPQMLGVSVLLGLYLIGLAFAGEGKTEDERAVAHRYFANRAALVAGTAVLCLGVLYQLFSAHAVDVWLLSGLFTINLVKLVSLIYSHYRK